MAHDETKGASANERLLAAARQDDEDLLLETFEGGSYNINCTDGLGNTPLHVAVANGSASVIEHILSDENCDVDPLNRIEKQTPLHLAARIDDHEMRYYMVQQLLDAGADTSIKDKYGETAFSLVPDNDANTRSLFRKSQVKASMNNDDIASDDDDGEPGSGSEEE